MGATGKAYKTPQQRSSEISQQKAREKEMTQALRAELSEKVQYENPRATKAAVDGIVTRMINNKLHDSQIADDPELTLKPDCTRTINAVKVNNQRWNVKSFNEM